ncbi:uncharacterized protein SPSK_06039 [Sporothrix schenckii 1099-18]|uniref:Uncharacterized protein n=1 Tax=Sporothrix schenckii 1099-18 TaxID=1397361 RepID=A0A0F2ML71_SPOSC|nr:uncharacterized protein SPSK_06039 [Sporothrix schenckii 1099-18]KJR89575.1 hypothetical protein SPSK_06039 [Sporothrix schenckii 1099-18]
MGHFASPLINPRFVFVYLCITATVSILTKLIVGPIVAVYIFIHLFISFVRLCTPHISWTRSQKVSDLTNIQRPSQLKGNTMENGTGPLPLSVGDTYLLSPQMSSQSSPSYQLSQEQAEYQPSYHLPPTQFAQQQYYDHLPPQTIYPEHIQPQQMLHIRLLEVQLRRQEKQNTHHKLPAPLSGQQQAQAQRPQHHDSTSSDISSDDADDSEQLRRGMQKELQEHIVHMQIQNPTPIASPLPTAMSQPVLSNVPTPTACAPQQTFDTQYSCPMFTQAPAPTHIRMEAPAAVPPQASAQMPPTTTGAHMRASSQLSTQAFAPANTPVPPPGPVHTNAQQSQQGSTILTTRCCLKTCTATHFPLPDVWEVDASGMPIQDIEAFDFTTVIFEKYDSLFDRLGVVDREMAKLGHLLKERVPIFERKSNSTHGQSNNQTASSAHISPRPASAPATATSMEMPPPPLPSPSQQGAAPSATATDERVGRLFKKARDTYLRNVEILAAKTRSSAEMMEEDEDEQAETTNSYAYRSSFLEIDRRRLVKLWTERIELLDKLTDVEKELADARDNGLMPWAKAS